jgi:hypothetical protein
VTTTLAAAVPAFIPYAPSASNLSYQVPVEFKVCYEYAKAMWRHRRRT